jgi:hypothetical protein
LTRFALVLAAILVATSAVAKERRAPISMTCRNASKLVDDRGAVVLHWGANRFERFVRDASFCPHGQTLRPAFAPTLDAPRCQVGWICFEEPLPDR